MSPEDQTHFNLIFEELLEFATEYWSEQQDEIGFKYLAYLAYSLNIEHILRDDLLDQVEQARGDASLLTKGELATAMGYRLREKSKTPQGFDSRLKRFQKQLRSFAAHLR